MAEPEYYEGKKHVPDSATTGTIYPAAQPETAPAQVAEPHVPEKEDDLTEAIEWWKQGSTTPEDAFTKNGLRLFVNALVAENAELRATLAAERERTLEKVLSAIERERLEEEPTEEGDKAYNRAIDHAKEAARIALSRTEPEAQK